MSKKGKRLREFEKNNRTYTFAERSKVTYKEKAKEEIIQNRPEKKKKKLKIVNMKRFIASVIVMILIASVGMSAINIIKLTIQKNELQAKNAELIKLKEDLCAEMEFINSADYIEQQARKDLKMIKENELLFIISDEDDKE